MDTNCDPRPLSGSSPHTRGLPEEDLERIRQQGIIPAHAGFTHDTSRQ